MPAVTDPGDGAPAPRSGSRRVLAAAVAAAAGVTLLTWGLNASFWEQPPPTAPASVTAAPSATTSSQARSRTSATTSPSTARASRSAVPSFGPSTVRPAGEPTRVVVVRGGDTVLVDASLVASRLDPQGVLAPPFGVAGWYAERGWAKPGWPGAAIVTGHINRSRPTPGPDTFARLVEVRPGDVVTVVYSSKQTATFTATRSKAVPKTEVPKDDSIWDSGNPEPVLRLITCDPSTPLQGGHYEGNWVVWATLR